MASEARKMVIESNWTSFDEQPLSKAAVFDLFSNTIPAIRHTGLLSAKECARLVEIIKPVEVGTYNPEVIFPTVGKIGISQFDYPQNKDGYLSDRAAAMALQNYFIKDANVDVVDRVMSVLHDTTGLPVRLAREDEREYFAGLLRVVDSTVQIHADFAPHDCAGWEIGRISAQLTWNILLSAVPGGETIIYDQQWRGASDDATFRKPLPSYAYSPMGLQGNVFKVMKPVEGDLTFFNSRNFHEVKPCDRTVNGPKEIVRLTMSSFVGLLNDGEGELVLIFWS